MYPESGGVYVYLREAFGPLLAFLYGWAALLIFFSGGIAAVAVGLRRLRELLRAGALDRRACCGRSPTPIGAWTLSAAQIVAVICIAALAWINYIGVRSGNRVNIVITIAKVAGLAALPIMALRGRRTRRRPGRRSCPRVARPLAAFGVAMIAVLWANDAWYCVTWIAGEMKHPQRDLPRALLHTGSRC